MTGKRPVIFFYEFKPVHSKAQAARNITTAFQDLILTQDREFFSSVIKNLIPRWEKIYIKRG